MSPRKLFVTLIMDGCVWLIISIIGFHWRVAPESIKANVLLFVIHLGLRKILLEKMLNEIPVISVISIMGTTEESAVDPLEDIFEIRKELSTMEKVY